MCLHFLLLSRFHICLTRLMHFCMIIYKISTCIEFIFKFSIASLHYPLYFLFSRMLLLCSCLYFIFSSFAGIFLVEKHMKAISLKRDGKSSWINIGRNCLLDIFLSFLFLSFFFDFSEYGSPEIQLLPSVWVQKIYARACEWAKEGNDIICWFQDSLFITYV